MDIYVCMFKLFLNRLAGLHADDGYNQAPPDGVNVWPMITAGETVRPASRWAAIGGPQKVSLP